MTAEMTISPCTESDLPAVHEMCVAWHAEDITRCYLPDSVEHLRGRMGPYFLVARVGGETAEPGRIVGFIVAQAKPTAGDELAEHFDTDVYLEVQDLYIRPEFRGQGIGSGLVREVLRRGRSAGIARSLVYSANKDYIRTARFYEKCGFEMWHIFMRQ